MNDKLATALEAASNNAAALEELLVENGDEQGAEKADLAKINLRIAAEKANAANAIATLGTTAANQAKLQKLAEQMDDVTAHLAQSEANLAKFVSIGTSAANLAVAITTVPVNVMGGISAVQAMLSTLGITV